MEKVEEKEKRIYTDTDRKACILVKKIEKAFANKINYIDVEMYTTDENGDKKFIQYYCIRMIHFLEKVDKLKSKKDMMKIALYFLSHPEDFKNEMMKKETIAANNKIIDEKIEDNEKVEESIPIEKTKKWNNFLNNFKNDMLIGSEFTTSDQQYEGGEPDFDYEDYDNLDDIDDYFEGEIELKVFTQINKEKIKDSCFYNSLLYYGINDKSMKGKKTYSEIKNYLLGLKRSFKIYYDTFTLDITDRKEMSKYTTSKTIVLENERNVKEKFFVVNESVKKSLIIESVDVANTEPIILCIGTNGAVCHIFVPDDPVLLYNGINTIYKQNGSKAKQIIKEKYIKTGYRYIFYDLETASDKEIKQYFAPVCISITYIDIDEKLLNQYTEPELKTIAQKNAYYNIDYKLNVYNELKKFMNEEKNNILISFNGSKFDNIFLAKSMKQNKQPFNVMVNAGMLELRNVVTSNLVFHTMDIKRFVGLGTLEKLCKSYVKDPELKKEKKELFLELNKRYNEKKLLIEDDYYKQLKEYAILDVVALAALTRSFYENFGTVLKDTQFEKDMVNCISLPQFVFGMFKKYIKNLKNKPKKFKKLFNKKGEIYEM
jgi:hypothetical protein